MTNAMFQGRLVHTDDSAGLVVGKSVKLALGVRSAVIFLLFSLSAFATEDEIQPRRAEQNRGAANSQVGSASKSPGQAATGSNAVKDAVAPRKSASSKSEYESAVVPFLKQYCLRCHGPDVQEGTFRVDRHLSNDFVTRSAAEKWSEVLDRLHRNEMPPEGEPRPPAQEFAKIIAWISRERLIGEKERKGTTTVLRRLNRVEYNNTVRELTGIDMQPANDFPADASIGGFDNNGRVLTISPLHIESYVKAAQQVIDRAIVTELQQPRTIRWRFELEQGNKGLDRYRTKFGEQWIIVNAGNNPIRGGMTVFRRTQWDSFGDFRDFKVPYPGYYTIRLRAAGIVPSEESARRMGPEVHQRWHDEEQRKLPDDESRERGRVRFEKYIFPYVKQHFAEARSYHYGPPRVKLSGYVGSERRIFGEFDVPDPESNPGTYEVTAWFEPVESGVQLINSYRIAPHIWNAGVIENDEFPRPELLVDWLELEGPIYDSWPPSSHRRILFDSPDRKDEEVYAREVLTHFMRRAFRRPVRDSEVEAKLALFRAARAEPYSFFERAIKAPLVAILSSPHFLYFIEEEPTDGDHEVPRQLTDSELATRLSYFLWSNLPDEQLFQLVEQRKLNSPDELIKQVDRMLAQPKSEQFVRSFAGQWLNLRDVGANPPSKNIYPEYDDHLEVSIRGESEAFFAHILHNDLSVLNFIQSDFITINERLARFYGIPEVRGDQFRAVKVPQGVPRGGLVTQVSMLTVTSNGTRTSPVKRGVWILDRLLGDPPPPPPPNAGDIPPGVPGLDKTTVRERLRLHRDQAQCAHCHSKIDPLGFALENFNACGDWRDREAQNNSPEYNENDPPIDARAQLPGGSEFVGVRGLQQELIKRQDQFLKCLAEKMYAYALGRELGYADEPMLASAVEHMKKNELTLRSLIHHVVCSEPFRSK